MKISYNSELETINTPIKAYVLGLYYADGFVTYKPESHSYFSGVSLHRDDKKVLEDIQKSLPIFIQTIGTNGVCTIRLNKKKACEDLIKNGVLPNKSAANKDNTIFPNIPVSLYHHFIRGFFDGDGSIFFATKHLPRNSKGFTFTSCNYFLIKKIREILYNEGIFMKFSWIRGGSSVIRDKEIVFNTLTFYLECRDISIIKKAFKYLYKDADVYMQRKYDTFTKWYEKDRNYTVCTRCGNPKALIHGVKNPRIVCYKCSRYSLIGKTYYDNLKPKQCKYCKGTVMVGNGLVKSRIDGKVVSKMFLCRNCNRSTCIKLCAP